MTFLSFFRPRPDGRAEPTPSDAARTLNDAKRDKAHARKIAFHDDMAARFGKPQMPRRQA